VNARDRGFIGSGMVRGKIMGGPSFGLLEVHPHLIPALLWTNNSSPAATCRHHRLLCSTAKASEILRSACSG